jgi:hypothetical protein
MRYISTDALDSALNYIKTNATIVRLCHSYPATYAEAITYSIGASNISTVHFSAPKAGLTSGRRITCEEVEILITASNNVTFLALGKVNTNTLMYVTETDSTSVIVNSIYKIKPWDIEINNPI